MVRERVLKSIWLYGYKILQNVTNITINLMSFKQELIEL